MTRFKELCMDTAENGTGLGRFWAAATGCSFAEPPAGDADDPGDVVGEVEGTGIAMCRVPERKTVKHRVHLDMHTDSVDTLLSLGATRAPGYEAEDPWTVLLAPEGGELCAFVRKEVPAYRSTSWWSTRPTRSGSPAGGPEPKTVKNRIHSDVYGDVDDLLAKGATRLWDQPPWTVLADPELSWANRSR